jgi:ABC-type molybdate transport system substrate-binding protein
MATGFWVAPVAANHEGRRRKMTGPDTGRENDGEAEIGLTQISEILPYSGAELVGPLPSEVQLTTTYVTAIGAGTSHADAAAALIKFITAPAAAPVFRAKGLDPAG